MHEKERSWSQRSREIMLNLSPAKDATKSIRSKGFVYWTFEEKQKKT